MILALILCLNARALGEKLCVMARPDGRRKTHSRATPQTGGISILAGFSLWLAGGVIAPQIVENQLMLTLLIAVGGLGVIGFIDDRHEIPPMPRIMMLLVFAATAFALDPELISQTLNWRSIGNIPISAPVYLVLMAVTSVGLVNAVNMADGQNGLVGGMFVVWTANLMLVTTGTLALMAGMLCALCVVFLAFNLNGKMFLGDCGSYGVTFAIGLMTTLAHARKEVPLETVIVWFFIPVADCLRLMITRKLQGRSPFEGGRDHFHHRLIDAMGPRRSAAAYVAAVAASSFCATLAPRFSLVSLCGLCAFYFSFARLSEPLVAPATQPATAEPNNVLPMSQHVRER